MSSRDKLTATGPCNSSWSTSRRKVTSSPPRWPRWSLRSDAATVDEPVERALEL